MTEEQHPDEPQVMTRLQLHNAARHVLKTAKAAKAAVTRDGYDGSDGILDELLLDFSAMTGRPDVLRPAVETREDIERLIQHVTEAAVFVGAHNWHPSDLHAILRGETAPERDPHAGERLMKEFLDGLGTVRLGESGDGADWAFKLAREAAAESGMCTTIVKAAQYVLHPSVLMIFGDVTKLLGNAVYAKNVSQLDECVAAIEGLTTELPPFGKSPSPEREGPEPELTAEDVLVLLGLEPDGPSDHVRPGEPEEQKIDPSALDSQQGRHTEPDPWDLDGWEGRASESSRDLDEWSPGRRQPSDDGTFLDL